MKNEHIIIVILILIILFLYTNKKEHLTGDEAVQNIAKVYADASGTVTFNNVTAGGTIDIINPNKTTEGTAKKWRFENKNYAPGTGENALQIWQFDGKTGSATSNFSFEDRGVLIAKNIYAPGWIHANSSLYAKHITTPDLSANNITVDISGANYIWGVDPNFIYRCKSPCIAPNTWEKIPGKLKKISVGKDYVFGIQEDNSIFRCKKPCDTGTWEEIQGKLTDIAADNYI